MNKVDLFYKPLLKEAWGITKKYYWIIFLFGLISITVSFGLSGSKENPNIILSIIAIIAGVFFKFWSRRLSMWLALGNKFKFINIFENLKNFKQHLITTIVYGLIVGVGPGLAALAFIGYEQGKFITSIPLLIVICTLLVIPSIFWSLKYFLAPYYSLDKGMAFNEALKASDAATDGVKAKVLLFTLLMCGIVLVSIIPLFLGLLLTVPMCFVISGLLYVRLSGGVAVVPEVPVTPVPVSAEIV